MNVDNVINELVDKGVKKPLPGPLMQTLYWLGPTLIFIAGTLLFLGVRPDISEKLNSPIYIAEMSSLLIAIIAFTITAFYYSRPDFYQKAWTIWLSFAMLIFPIAFSFIGTPEYLTMVDFQESLHNHMGLKCTKCITICTIPPILFLFIMLRLGTSPYAGITGLLAALASTLLSYAILRIHEPNDNPAHIIIWHILPIFVIALLGFLAGYIFLKWKK